MSQNKVIYVNSCQECPFNGKCKAWKALTKPQRLHLSIGNSVPHDMMLKACPLEDKGE